MMEFQYKVYNTHDYKKANIEDVFSKSKELGFDKQFKREFHHRQKYSTDKLDKDSITTVTVCEDIRMTDEPLDFITVAIRNNKTEFKPNILYIHGWKEAKRIVS